MELFTALEQMFTAIAERIARDEQIHLGINRWLRVAILLAIATLARASPA